MQRFGNRLQAASACGRRTLFHRHGHAQPSQGFPITCLQPLPVLARNLAKVGQQTAGRKCLFPAYVVPSCAHLPDACNRYTVRWWGYDPTSRWSTCVGRRTSRQKLEGGRRVSPSPPLRDARSGCLRPRAAPARSASASERMGLSGPLSCARLFGPDHVNSGSYSSAVPISAACSSALSGANRAHASRKSGKTVTSPAVHSPVTSCESAKLMLCRT